MKKEDVFSQGVLGIIEVHLSQSVERRRTKISRRSNRRSTIVFVAILKYLEDLEDLMKLKKLCTLSRRQKKEPSHLRL